MENYNVVFGGVCMGRKCCFLFTLSVSSLYWQNITQNTSCFWIQTHTHTHSHIPKHSHKSNEKQFPTYNTKLAGTTCTESAASDFVYGDGGQNVETDELLSTEMDMLCAYNKILFQPDHYFSFISCTSKTKYTKHHVRVCCFMRSALCLVYVILLLLFYGVYCECVIFQTNVIFPCRFRCLACLWLV